MFRSTFLKSGIHSLLGSLLAAAFLLLVGAQSASAAESPLLITQGINENQLFELKGNIRPEMVPANDRGAVDASFPMEHLQLLLKRAPEREAALSKFVDELHNPKSANYHHWISADKFGEDYGLNEQDIATVSGWLQSHGFTVNTVYPGQNLIDFSGNAGQVLGAFHTQIHRLSVNGETHFANASNPKIPLALAPATLGLLALHDFEPHPLNVRKTSHHPKSSLHPDYTYNDQYQLMTPGDLATIYNLAPLFAAGFSGQGETIVVVDDSDLYDPSNWDTFRATFGLGIYSAPELVTTHPAPPKGINNCSDPGVGGAEDESTLDTQWATAAAPSAAIQLASCRNLDNAIENVVSSATPPQVMSISYGECEAALGASSNAFYSTTYEQAVVEGISVFVSSGDEGAASCDANQAVATHGVGVSGFTSTPYNVSVGGTDFGDSYAGTNATYWSATNSATFASALSYIPEIPWNDSCASVLIATYVGDFPSYGADGFCNSTVGEEFLTTASGSGGPSGCATGAPATKDVVGGSCMGTPKPTWQTGVVGIPDDGVRDIPDVSLFAANGVWGHYYVVCDTNSAYGYSCPTDDPSQWIGFGGTSVSSPIMAGIQAIADQASGQLLGNPNYFYYSTAAAAYGTTGSSTCDSTLGNGTSSSCVFYDVTLGDMDVNCTGTIDCYLPSGTNGVLSTSSDSYVLAYGTNVGWDFSTGIGTVNAYNLVMAFTPKITFTPTSVSFGGNHNINDKTKPQTVTLTNTGGSTLVIGTITPAPDFPETDDCAATSIPPGGTCSLQISFLPKDAKSYSETLTVASNVIGGTTSLAITGGGANPPSGGGGAFSPILALGGLGLAALRRRRKKAA